MASIRLRDTEPRMNVGIANTGRARTMANVRRLTAVRADTASACRTPAWTSMRYCRAAPIAPPPGATLASALPASCEAMTGRHARMRRARRWSSHRHASEAPWSTAITGNQ